MSCMFRNSLRFFGLILLALVVGCGAGGSALYPVKGRVLLQGKPIKVKQNETAFVEFHPDVAAGNQAKTISNGVVDANGNYEMKTGESSGVPAGSWLITVTYQVAADANAKDADLYVEPRSLIDIKYDSAETTPLKREVKSGGAGDFDLTVTK